MKKAAFTFLVFSWSVPVAIGACAHRPEGPGATVAAFGSAIARGDLRSAYALTSADFQRRMPFEGFAAGFKAGGGEPETLGRRMVAEAPRIAPRVEVELALGERVPLVVEEGRWRIDGPVYDAWGQGTPRAALRTFIRALDERRYDVLLRLAPDRYRSGLTLESLRAYWEGPHKKENDALLAQLRAASSAPVVEEGDEAHMPYPSGSEIRLVREGGRWKVEDPGQNQVVTNGEH